MTDQLYFLDLGHITFSGNNTSAPLSIKPFDLATETWQPSIATGGPVTLTQGSGSPPGGSSSSNHNITVKSNGNIVVVWSDYDNVQLENNIKVSEWNGTSWSIPVLAFENTLLPFTGLGTNVLGIGIDKSDRVHCLLYTQTHNSPAQFSIYYFTYYNGNITTPISIYQFASGQTVGTGTAGFGRAAYDSINDTLFWPVRFNSGTGVATLALISIPTASIPGVPVFEVITTTLGNDPASFVAISPIAIYDSGTYYVYYINGWTSVSPVTYNIEHYSRSATGSTWTHNIDFSNQYTIATKDSPFNLTGPISLARTSLGLCGLVPWPLDGSHTAPYNTLMQVALRWFAGTDPINVETDINRFAAFMSYPNIQVAAPQEFYGPWVRNGVHYVAVKSTLLTDTNGSGNLIKIFKTTDGLSFSLCDGANSPVYSSSPGITTDALVQVVRYTSTTPFTLDFKIQFGRDSNSGQGSQSGGTGGPLPSSPGIQCGGGGECTSIDGPTPTFSGNFGSASVFCYDLGQKYWYRFANDPGNFFVEEDGTLLAGYSDGYLRKLDSGDDYDGITPISIGIITPFFDGGTPAQRKDTYTLKFFVDTGGEPLNVEVVYEGFGPLGFEDSPVGNIISLGSMVSDGIAEFCFTNLKGTAMNLNKRFQIRICGSTHRFRLAYWTLDYDERPIPLSYKRTDPTNYGETGRKRITEIPFVVDTYGQNIQAIALLDGVEFPAQTINTNEKLNAAYYFTQEQYAREIGLLLVSPCGLFEYYELTKPQFIDVIPDLVKYYYIPEDNFGEPARKRLRTIPLVINTFGTNITYTPIIDQVQLPPLTINTARKQTVLYYLVAGATVDDIIGTDFAGTLDGGGTNFFEFYGYGKFDLIDTLPLRTEHFFVPEDNLGIPSRKRVRTIPFIINTFGNPVSVTPVVDGVAGTTRTFITSSKRTQYYFFDTDSFGVDYALVIYGTSPFEFYGIVRPTDVEELPVPKVYDQLGPYQYDRVASLYRARVRILTTTAQLNWNLINNDNSILTGTVTTIPNTDRVYDIRFPRMIQLNVARFELSATAMFHRWSVEFLANQTGMESDNKWVTIS